MIKDSQRKIDKNGLTAFKLTIAMKNCVTYQNTSRYSTGVQVTLRILPLICES